MLIWVRLVAFFRWLRDSHAAWTDAQVPWRMLRYFNLYRLCLSGLMLVLAIGGSPPEPFGAFDARLFGLTSAIYLICALLNQAAVEARVGTLTRQVGAQVTLDTLTLCALMYASGGIASGFGILLVISIGGASLIVSGLAVMWLAAQTTLAILVTTLISVRFQYAPLSEVSQAGLMGLFLFTVGIGGFSLAERVRRSEALAQRRAQDIATLSELNESIVQRMRSGVLVLDAVDQVVLHNEAAGRLAHLQEDGGRLAIDGDAPLGQALARWRQTGVASTTPVSLDPSEPAVLLSFTRLGAPSEGRTLVFLDDAAETFQRAQQLKLVSLGRLTASIAHEVRNPLGAISHASQLLGEASELAAGDRRLIEIINQHCWRVNEIIENVMQLGRREAMVSETFPLDVWLQEFAEDYRAQMQLAETEMVLDCAASVEVRMDKSQLRQVLVNLCDNALRYSNRTPRIRLICREQADTGRPTLEVADTGPGMQDEVAMQVFEPFFTDSPGGTGLGLYIARELCENNQAALSLVGNGPRGCVFRILFAHPQRRQITNSQELK